ncbi:PREDICTED: IAP 1 [Prunus dulcis]|uniref:PREDICTED: IAP 1 n=1 Tax=Prunus dulcis TaxID=3755 RepID=A0A5E4F2U7_PRUDU|nr:uncharacterized protein LOC117627890 [Prunus dulcis]VVA21409.1 PREDICTED: IAP 1 [Prunus dulcis]
MSKDSEKRFHSIMDKLFFAPKSAPSPTSGSSSAQTSRGKKRANPSSALALVEPKSRSDRVEAAQHLSVPPAPAHAPLCRPWDRGDLMRRVATFKSMTWFAKPKVVSAINCARRGWINVDTDIIACESCGARLFFSTPSSWNQQQVEKAALVFSLKLDNGHKILCPWIDNTCDEILAEFPPTPPPVLVDKFRERCSALLQLSVLPVISSSAIQYMKSPQLEQFLGQSSMFYGNGSGDIARTEHSDNEGSADSAKLYYQAQKLISLCGWEPRSLPYVVDSENRLNHSVMKANISSSSHSATNGQNPSINVHSTRNDELVEVERNASTSSSIQSEPNSVVLDCKLCGASVGLWAFSTVPRPLEFFRLVGYAEVHSESHPGTPDSSTKNHLDNRVDTVGAGSDGATLSKERFSNLNLTIAGGPPPTKQNFKATISLPVIGRNLRARFSYDSEFRDSMSVSQEVMQSDSQMDKGDKHDRENAGNVGLENSEVRDPRTASDANITYENGETDKNDSLVMVSSEGKLLQSGIVVDGSEKQDSPSVPSNLEDNADVNSSITDAQPTSNCEGSENRVLIPINNELVACSSGKDLTHVLPGCTMEFDPIRQHRYFCPWIVSAGNGAPGWKQTLSALQRQEGGSPSSKSIIKVDDPVTSIRNLFTSPPPKRMKPTVLTRNTKQ